MDIEKMMSIISSFSQEESIYFTNEEIRTLSEYIIKSVDKEEFSLPCKIGNDIFIVKPISRNVKDAVFVIHEKVVGFHIIENPNKYQQSRESYLISHNNNSKTLRHIPFNKVGKTAFFSLEEVDKMFPDRRLRY